MSGFRADVKITKFVPVSTSGCWEMANFGTVLRIVKELAKDLNVEFAGALLRPNFRKMAENKEKAEKIFEASKQAGYELIKEGKMSKDLLKAICQPLISQGKWRAGIMSNMNRQSNATNCEANLSTHSQGRKKGQSFILNSKVPFYSHRA